jgi:hypothetical protein
MTIRLAAILLALLGLASLAQADIPSPRPKPAPPAPVIDKNDKSVPLTFETVEGNGPTRVIIPKKFAGPMKAAGLDTHSTDAIAEQPRSRMPAILAGLFLTLSLTFTGLWLVRSRGLVGPRTVAIILAGVAMLGLGTALVCANAPAPRPALPAPIADNGDRVIIEVVEQGDAVKVIIAKSRVQKLAGLPVRFALPPPPGQQPVPPQLVPAQPAPNGPVGKPEVKPLPAPVKPVDGGGVNGAFAPVPPAGAAGEAAPAKPLIIKE